MKERQYSLNQMIVFVVASFLVGTLWVIGVRMATLKDMRVHYHANFALYINGVRDKFDGPGYYEEVSACDSGNTDNPKIRVHMHDENSHVIHVHDHAVTWSDFFANLGYTLGDNLIKTNNGVYIDGQGGKLTFMLNGRKVSNIADSTVGDQDVLLISFGKEDQAGVQKQYDSIQKDAKTFDETADPSTCSGSAPLTLSERFKQSVGLSQPNGN